jgi:hypothetical protein
LHQGIVRKDLSTKENREEAVKQLTGLEWEEATWVLKTIDLHEERMVEQEKPRTYGSKAAERKGDKEIERLMNVPGAGPVVSLAFVSFLGAGSRFDNASQVSNYLGLIPRVDISGTIRGITKRGNKYLRALVVPALVRSKKGGALKERYTYMTQTKGLGKKKSIVAIARRLAELLWALVRNGTDYEIRKFTGPPKSTPVEAMVTEALASETYLQRGLGAAKGKALKKIANSLDINHRKPPGTPPGSLRRPTFCQGGRIVLRPLGHNPLNRVLSLFPLALFSTSLYNHNSFVSIPKGKSK